MGWFKKGEQGERYSQDDISELPELPELPNLPELRVESKTSSLPRLPTSRLTREIPESSSLFSPLNAPLTKEISSGKEEVTRELDGNMRFSNTGGKPRTFELEQEAMPEWKSPIIKPIPRQREEKTEPVFVRIDKYNAAIQAFNEIKSQLDEIENYLKEVRTLKQQEEQELVSWEEQIESIKTRLNNIDQGVFGKLG